MVWILENNPFNLTSAIDPWPQIVMEGKSISDIGFAVVLREVKTGLSCHSVNAYEMIHFHQSKAYWDTHITTW